jgi:FtsP/CotA-like multicopper oxidase with cupredoxin domain
LPTTTPTTLTSNSSTLFARIALAAALLLALISGGTSLVVAQGVANLPHVAANDNRSPAGTLTNGTLEVKLEITSGLWHPEAEDGMPLRMEVFAEEGKAPVNPGPLIRVVAGTDIHVSIHNTLSHAAVIHGLHTRPGTDGARLELAPSSTGDVRFRAGAPGTYFYWATTSGAKSYDTRDPSMTDSQLVGAFIVDPVGGALPDRVFVLNLVDVPDDPFHDELGTFVINGKSWPFTERLTYHTGDHARWRWINVSTTIHPMHLHGSYFNVVAVGDVEHEETYDAGATRSVVTEPLPDGGTMTVDWVPEHAGRWIFHCHLTPHFGADSQLPSMTYPDSWGPDYKSLEPAATNHDHMSHDDMTTSAGMAGLVMGILVLPGATTGPAPSAPVSATAARKLDLVVAPRAHGPGNTATFGYSVREDGRELPSFGAMTSPPIVLTQNEPVEVRIVNQLTSPTAVHWHGIELESYFDGVVGWGGDGQQVTPPIAPGGSFVARFTPPRAGTFIYHTHWHDPEQLVKGLYGPLIVLPPGERFDPETDKIVLISIDGKKPKQDPFLVNGTTQPSPMALRVGTRYRFRLINITADNPSMMVSLMNGDQPVSWRAIAKDGADLPERQRVTQVVQDLRVSVGETFDFEFVPRAPAHLQLDVYRPADKKHVVTAVDIR